MSYSMGSIDCIAVRINEAYLKAFREDIEKGILNEDLEDYKVLDDLRGIDDFLYFDYEENYAYAYQIDINSGQMLRMTGDTFEGYVHPISYGTANIYAPEFKNKEDLIETIKESMYVPTNFDLENNVIYLTGVWGG